MTNILNKTELVEIRDNIFGCIDASIKRRNALVSSGKMTQAESDQIAQKENDCQKVANQLNSLVLKSIVTDLDAPGSKIIIATKKLNSAIAKLEQWNKLIGILGVVFNIATKIITAVSTSNPLAIVSVLQDAESFF